MDSVRGNITYQATVWCGCHCDCYEWEAIGSGAPRSNTSLMSTEAIMCGWKKINGKWRCFDCQWKCLK